MWEVGLRESTITPNKWSSINNGKRGTGSTVGVGWLVGSQHPCVCAPPGSYFLTRAGREGKGKVRDATIRTVGESRRQINTERYIQK